MNSCLLRQTRALFAPWLAALLLVTLTGCARGPLLAAGATMVAVRGTTIVVSGQSNAMFLAPFLSAVYPDVKSVAEGSQSIDLWAPDGRLWLKLAPQLQAHPRAFVWWQGESDGQLAISGYPAKLADLLRRVRETAHDPSLLILIVRVVPMPELDVIRAAETAWVATDGHARLVSCDDLPRENDGSYHLADAGYRQMAQRLIALLP